MYDFRYYRLSCIPISYHIVVIKHTQKKKWNNEGNNFLINIMSVLFKLHACLVYFTPTQNVTVFSSIGFPAHFRHLFIQF